MDYLDMVLKLSTAVGVAGMEQNATKTALELLEPLGKCGITPLGSLYCRIKEASPEKPHLLLTAHIDEIGMIVTYIDDKGFLRVSNCGGVDRATLWAAQVTVHTRTGEVEGVICTIPPHLNPDESKLPKLDEISIDIGMSEIEAKKIIALGDRVTLGFVAHRMPENRICCKATDDRSGCAAIIGAAVSLAQEKLDCSLTVLLATMEEVGGQGAQTGAALLLPTHAIAVDVSFAHTPDAVRHQCGELGKGAMIGIAPILDNKMFGKMKDIAQREKIPYQVEVMSSRTGTDADSVAISGAGVHCALLSIPQKYMHTPIEIIAESDVRAVAQLITAYVKDEFGGVSSAT